ncbi:unnamed protein product [Hymenolepis diminuta]|nr:unnamed protein product [Hymenolepis diminuta]
MKDKLEKRNFAERQAATEKQIDNIKQMHIEKLLGDITEKDTQIRDLSERLAAHERTKNQALEKALRDVETLKKRLADERKLKKIAIHKVDDLLSQVYEYEIAQAFKQAPSHQASSEASPNLSESISPKKGGSGKTDSIRLACRNYYSRAKGYEGLLRRIKAPYTPQHYLEHRRKMVMVPHLQQNLAHEILGEYPPATHKEVAETQALENKQEKRHSSK